MVLIRRKSRGHRSSSLLQWVTSKTCLLVLVAMAIVVASGVVRLQHSLTEKHVDSRAGRIGRKEQQSFFARKKLVDKTIATNQYWDHPSLHLENPLLAEPFDFYDTIATEIIQILDCHALLSSHNRIEINSQLVYGILPTERTTQPVLRVVRDTDQMAEPPGSQKQRRLQHVDDIDAREKGDGGDDTIPGVVRIGTAERHLGNGKVDDDAAGHTALLTGAHLFCLAAFPSLPPGMPEDKDATVFWKDRLHCNVRSWSNGDTIRSKQRSLLDLWSTARAEIPDDNILKQTLRFATEQAIILVDTPLYVWTAPDDIGLIYTTKILNEQVVHRERQTSSDSGIAGLKDTLGPGKLFVDVGSGLGLTAMAVAILYPGTEIVSIEAAPTNWLLQEMNWRCNDFRPHHQPPDDTSEPENVPPEVHLAGVGISSGSTSQLAKFLWRPTATTSTRAWGLSLKEEGEKLKEVGLDDLEVTVKLRSWHYIESEANIKGRSIDVLNLDCEGCEYNLIPALSTKDFDAIRIILGSVHWGEIPSMKLPSSKRGSDTHGRLCRHEAFARFSIECCAFPDVKVQSSVSGNALAMDPNQLPSIPSTVKDVAGSLCDGFPTWAITKNLFNVESDWGWLQGVSMRQKM